MAMPDESTFKAAVQNNRNLRVRAEGLRILDELAVQVKDTMNKLNEGTIVAHSFWFTFDFSDAEFKTTVVDFLRTQLHSNGYRSATVIDQRDGRVSIGLGV